MASSSMTPSSQTLYADVYFDVNGFDEAGTGDRGVPPEIIQAGRDTLAAYFLTRPGIDTDWVASFFGVKRERIETYVEWVRQRGRKFVPVQKNRATPEYRYTVTDCGPSPLMEQTDPSQASCSCSTVPSGSYI